MSLTALRVRVWFETVCSLCAWCRRFFEAFDNDRDSLAPAYAPLCTFSFFTDTAHPVRTKAKKIGSHNDKKFPNQYKLDWKQYLTSEGSRNLARVKNGAKRVATLKLTPEDVVKSIKALPKTSHPLSEGEKFVFDAWTVPGLVGVGPESPEGEMVIYAVVQGQFTECEYSWHQNLTFRPSSRLTTSLIDCSPVQGSTIVQPNLHSCSCPTRLAVS